MDAGLIQIDPETKRVVLTLSSKSISGLTKLTQIVVLSLLNVPGKDVMDPGFGGGLPELVGMNISSDDMTELFAEVALRVRKTQTEIVNSQVGVPLPSEERLREIQIIAIDQGVNIDEVLVRLRVINERGQAAEVVI